MMSFFGKKPSRLTQIIILGLTLRLILLFLDFGFDVNNHIVWAKEAIKYGLPGFYERAQVERFTTTYPNYSPLAIFLFIIAYGLYQFVFKATWRVNLWLPLFPSKLVIFLEKRQALAGFMKLPAVFFDLALVVLIYRWIRMKKDKNNIFGPLAAVSFILFNPGFFYNSSYFGQIESIPLFFILLSLYLLFFSKMHERHLQQALPFLLVVGLKDKKFLKAFFYFSLVYFINIYHNWPVPKIIFLENFVNSPMVVNGVIIVSLIVYSWLVANYYADKKTSPSFC